MDYLLHTSEQLVVLVNNIISILLGFLLLLILRLQNIDM